MLVIISDLHLTDGTSGATIKHGAFKVFYSRLRDLAYDASCRADGKYEPIRRMDVLLLGDILDVIRSTQWSGVAVRPWDDSSKFGGTVQQITAKILQNNEASLNEIRKLTQDKGLTIPPAKNGKVDETVSWNPDDARRVPVAVKFHYMIGNHDWFFHLPGEPFNQIRRKIVEAMSLQNDPTKPFPHRPEESDTLMQLMKEHKILAVHGDQYDDFNFEHERNRSSLGDAIVIELLNKFAGAVQNAFGAGELDPRVIAGLREVDNVRPSLMVPVWVNGLLRRCCSADSHRRRIKDEWDKLTKQFLSIGWVKNHDTWIPGQPIDDLQLGLQLSASTSISAASEALNWINKRDVQRAARYYKDAMAEDAYKNRSARYIVFGHTHHHEVTPLDVTDDTFEQVYINSGTWRRVHTQAKAVPDELEFISSDVMTYLAFFKDDERGGRPYETWSGSLGLGKEDIMRTL